MHNSTSVQTPALRSVGNIVTGDDLQTQVVIASGALPALLSLLSSPKDGIRKEACWTISNVTAGSPPQIQSVIDANIIPPLINILQNADFKTRKEACWAISNATSGGLQEPAQIRYLVSQGCIKPLCDLLTMMDNKIIQVALDGLDNILKIGEIDKAAAGPGAVNQYALYVEEAGGMITIHNLQQHDNLEIYKKAFNIMDKYFPDEEDVDAAISAPNVDATGAFAVSVTCLCTTFRGLSCVASVPLGRQCSSRRIQFRAVVRFFIYQSYPSLFFDSIISPHHHIFLCVPAERSLCVFKLAIHLVSSSALFPSIAVAALSPLPGSTIILTCILDASSVLSLLFYNPVKTNVHSTKDQGPNSILLGMTCDLNDLINLPRSSVQLTSQMASQILPLGLHSTILHAHFILTSPQN